MGEIDMNTFFNKIIPSELKERVVVTPSVDPTENGPNYDVDFKISSDMHNIESKDTLDMPPTNNGELTYADVLKEISTRNK